MLGFGLVFFTSLVIGYASAFLIPGFTLALGFLLGGIVSPPDAVAAATVLKTIRVPKRLMTILEGESLVNDAASLIVFRFAVAAVLTGTFSAHEATGQFFVVSGMGIVVGLAGAHIMYVFHRFLPTTPPIDAALTVMTPYLLFLTAEQFHFSGVMAVVSGGLFISYRSHEVFQTGKTRMNMLGVWTTMIFVMNALVFVLIGLELPDILEGLGKYAVRDGVLYGLMISAIAIVLRFLWVFPSAHIPRWLSKKIRREPSPGWKGPFIISWAGMRGVVSLATALSIPLVMADGSAFPQRNLIIFITFVVIFITLVFQGLTLPWVVKMVKIREIDERLSAEEQQEAVQLRLDNSALIWLDQKYAGELETNELLGLYKTNLKDEIRKAERRIESLECADISRFEVSLYHKVLLEIYAMQRKELFRMRKENSFDDEIIREAELQLDLNELAITGSGH